MPDPTSKSDTCATQLPLLRDRHRIRDKLQYDLFLFLFLRLGADSQWRRFYWKLKCMLVSTFVFQRIHSVQLPQDPLSNTEYGPLWQ